MASQNGPLYMGLDLSTQQLKAVLITSSLKVVHEAKVDFDADLSHYGIKHGVFHPAPSIVNAPVLMWIEALDLVISRLKDTGAPLERVAGISGAGQQHGTVYWTAEGEKNLNALSSENGSLKEQLKSAFAIETSPNWQDASTQKECDALDALVGGPEQMAQITGSKSHHRFSGAQIMKLVKNQPKVYANTSRISLVSSFLASLFLGTVAPIDVSDVCGMNLWDISASSWSDRLLSLAAGSADDKHAGLTLRKKLGDVRLDGGGSMGSISQYFVSKYGFSKDCQIAPFTGDNPSTILSLPLRAGDAMVSLGTSTTFLMSTPNYVPDPSTHFFSHPTTDGLYMFMLCYKNGGLAREKVRDMLNKHTKSSIPKSWSEFEKQIFASRPLGQKSDDDIEKVGLYFPLPEIVPNVRAGIWRFDVQKDGSMKQDIEWQTWDMPSDDARAIVESQVLSLKLRSRQLVTSPGNGLPAQPRRIYLVGGGSLSPAIARVVGDVLGGVEGVYKLDVGGNACALGGAYKATWALERKEGQKFEDLIGERWNECEAIVKVDDGYKKEIWDKYENILDKFEECEKMVLAGEKR